MSKYPELVFLNTRNMIGRFLPKTNRIELSRYLKDYPELFEFVFMHELEHLYIFHTNGFGLKSLIKNIYLDMKDRFKFYFNKELSKQRVELMKPNNSTNLREVLYIMGYNILGGFIDVGVIFSIIGLKIIKWLGRKIINEK